MKKKLIIMPFWVTEDLDLVTEQSFVNYDVSIMEYIFEGIFPTDCEIPCMTTKVCLRLIYCMGCPQKKNCELGN